MKFITRGLVLFVKHVLLRSLARDATRPDRCQAAVLRRILKRNRLTSFGKANAFASIDTIEKFIKQIPVQGYEEIRPYIERQITTGEYSLVPENPVMYAQTSGTTGKPKYIPILKRTIRSYKHAQRIFSYVQYRDVPGIFAGKLLAIVSPAIEGYLEDGTPFGSMSGLVYQNMPDTILSKYVLPPAIFGICDYEVKYRLITAFALREANISCMATANPSTLIKIGEIIDRHYDQLVKFVESGDFDVLDIRLDESLKVQLSRHGVPAPRRAESLRALKRNQGKPSFGDLWPTLLGVVTWTSGNCALLLPRLRNKLLPETAIIEMGYLSSEFRGTITVECERNLGLPTLQDNFFEFAELESWDGGNRNTLLLSQLQPGKKYYIIVTSPHGLYRYFINDIIEVTGHFQNTPTIAFLQKGKGVTSLTGEKLYESQVVTAVQATAGTYGIYPEFFIMLADRADFSYTLYLEADGSFEPEGFAQQLNADLYIQNIEYQSKVQSGRIKPIMVKRLLPGTLEAYKSFCIQAGQREGQFKIVKLQYRHEVNFLFEDRLLP